MKMASSRAELLLESTPTEKLSPPKEERLRFMKLPRLGIYFREPFAILFRNKNESIAVTATNANTQNSGYYIASFERWSEMRKSHKTSYDFTLSSVSSGIVGIRAETRAFLNWKSVRNSSPINCLSPWLEEKLHPKLWLLKREAESNEADVG